MKVKVYFNLHKKLFSVVALEGPNKGRVIDHVDSLELERCSFRVQSAGRERVIRENRKNVHAYISGIICSSGHTVKMDGEATYNPYRYSTFVNKQNESPIFSKERCSLIAKNGRAQIFTLG